MKTVEIVNTAKGCYVTRRYCGMNQGREYFTKIAPADLGVRKAKKFLAEIEQNKNKYITDWIGE